MSFSRLVNPTVKLLKDNDNSIANNENKIKLWHLGLIFGIPSASLIAYFLYRYFKNQNREKNLKKKVIETRENVLENKKKIEKEIQSPKKELTLLAQAIEKKNKGNEYFQKSDYEQAAKYYSEAIELCPKTDKNELPKFYQNRAAAFENMKLFEHVIEDCNSALKIDPKYLKALTRRAKAYENVGKLNEAFEDLTSLCIYEKFSSSSMALADKIVKKIGEKMAADIFAKRNGLPISQHFVNNFYIGLNNDTIYNNKKFYQEVELNTLSLMKNAIDQFNAGNYDKCIESCTKEIEENKQYVFEAINLRGSLYMLKCQYKDAKNDFNFILTNDNCSNSLKSNTYIKLTALSLQNGEDKEAFENYEKAIQIDSNNEDIYCNRAQVFAMKGLFEECFKDFDKCLEINPNHKIAKLQKAFFEFRQFYAQFMMFMQATNQTNYENSKELQKETAKLEKVISEYSDIPEAYNLYAQILSEQENFEKAENYYKIALEKDPKNAALIVQRALNYMTWKNDFVESINMLNHAISIDDTCEFAYETLATIEIQRGELKRAVELFEKAINLTRSEDSMKNLCCMLIGAKTQNKILSQTLFNPS